MFGRIIRINPSNTQIFLWLLDDMRVLYPRKKRNAYSRDFFFSIFLIYVKDFSYFIDTVSSPIIHMFMPENSFDSVQIGVNFQSGNKGKVKIKCHKCCKMNYGHHLRANTLTPLPILFMVFVSLKKVNYRNNLKYWDR